MKKLQHVKKLLGTYIGAAVGFVLFVLFGAVPGVLYGGYAGMTMGHILFESDLDLVIRVMTIGGMILGFLPVLFLFVVTGAVLGTFIHGAWNKINQGETL